MTCGLVWLTFGLVWFTLGLVWLTFGLVCFSRLAAASGPRGRPGRRRAVAPTTCHQLTSSCPSARRRGQRGGSKTAPGQNCPDNLGRGLSSSAGSGAVLEQPQDPPEARAPKGQPLQEPWVPPRTARRLEDSPWPDVSDILLVCLRGLGHGRGTEPATTRKNLGRNSPEGREAEAAPKPHQFSMPLPLWAETAARPKQPRNRNKFAPHKRAHFLAARGR